jgi:hypothetical protein
MLQGQKYIRTRMFLGTSVICKLTFFKQDIIFLSPLYNDYNALYRTNPDKDDIAKIG